MKRKFILLFFFVMLCCGCEANYTLRINEDLTVSETLRATEPAEFFQEYGNSSVQRVIGFILEPNLEVINENKYNIGYINETDKAGASLSKEYQSLEEYAKNTKITGQYGPEVSYTKQGDEVTLSITGSFSRDEQDQEAGYKVDTAVINVIVPFEVTNHNADSFDKDTNTYTWNFDENSTSKTLTLTFNQAVQKEEKSSDWYVYLGIGLIVILILVYAGLTIVHQNKIRNQMDE